jgi:hypothetical protein
MRALDLPFLFCLLRPEAARAVWFSEGLFFLLPLLLLDFTGGGMLTFGGLGGRAGAGTNERV